MTKPNGQHQFDLLYMPHDLFKGNMHKYISTGPLEPKKSIEIAFVFKEEIYKKGGVFKYPKVFPCDNGSEFKKEVTKLLEKHNVDIRTGTTK